MEEFPESYNPQQEQEQELEQEEQIQNEEDVKIFESKYDNEFIGLLNEIGKRMENFNKHDNLKIKSWINLLTIPCETNETKKNRNLYGIKLINQMINGKLEEPFIKYANGINDLKWLSPIEVKSELSKKFMEEINFKEIENFGIQQQKKFLNIHPNIANKIKNQNNTNSKNNMIEYNNNNNNDNNNNLNLNYSYNDNDMDDNNLNNYNYNNNSSEKPNYTDDNNYYGDSSNTDMGQIQFKRGNINNRNNNKNKTADFSVIHNKINSYKNYNDKIKLINIIRDLEQKVIERDEIIEFQNKQIEQIRNRINFIQNLQNNNNANYEQ